MRTGFHFIPLWVMCFLTICLILSTNKTRAPGLLRQCNPTLEWVRAHDPHTCITSTHVHVPMHNGKLLPIEPFNKYISYVPKNTAPMQLAFIRPTSQPHLSFFLSSVSNLHIGLWASSSRLEVWEAIFALEPFTVAPSFSRHGRVPEGGCNLAHLECCVST